MTDINFDDMSEPAEERPAADGGVRKGGILYLQAPALNSIELAIRALMAQHAKLRVDIGFYDERDEHEIKHRNEFSDDKPEPASVRSDTHNFYQHHASLARSLGSAATWKEYLDACKDEGMTPLSLADYK